MVLRLATATIAGIIETLPVIVATLFIFVQVKIITFLYILVTLRLRPFMRPQKKSSRNITILDYTP